MDKHVKALQEALAQQRKYERENWPFVGEKNQPTGTGESITYHLAGLYQWSPEYVLTLPPEQRDERLREIWSSFAIAGDIIKRYEDATVALLATEVTKDKQEMLERMDLLQNLIEAQAVSIAMLRETTDTAIKHLAGHVSHLAQQFSIDHNNQGKEE